MYKYVCNYPWPQQHHGYFPYMHYNYSNSFINLNFFTNTKSSHLDCYINAEGRQRNRQIQVSINFHCAHWAKIVVHHKRKTHKLHCDDTGFRGTVINNTIKKVSKQRWTYNIKHAKHTQSTTRSCCCEKDVGGTVYWRGMTRCAGLSSRISLFACEKLSDVSIGL